MIALILPFMALAGLGFLLSLAIHVIALVGRVPPGGEAVMAMHFGVFVVWLPAMLVSMRLNQGQPRRGWRGWNTWRNMLAGCPTWMKYGAYGLFAYAFLNFFLAFGGKTENPSGGIADPLTLRGFSGHWMLFYGLAFAILFSAFREPWRLKRIKCPAGHEVSHADKFCASCGAGLPDPRASA